MRNQKSQICIVLFGSPGSGKTTLANEIEERVKLGIIETGSLLRARKTDDTETGKKLKSFLDRGKLVPADLVVRVIKNALTSIEEKRVVFDGFPRSKDQVDPFHRLLTDANMLLKQIIILNISRSLAFKRLSGRRICPNCGKIYNIYFNPPRTKNTCDECGEKLIRRDDDDPKIVNRRLDKYEKNTEPVIKYFKTTYPKQCLQLPADKPIDENVEYVLKEWKRLELY